MITVDLENNDRLVMKIWHDAGRYLLSVRKEFVERRDGYEMVTTVPFAEGNFFAIIKEGRKSAKQLAKGAALLEQNKSRYLELWGHGDYAGIVANVMTGMK